MDIVDYNRRAWNAQVAARNRWTVPVSTELVEQARAGTWQLVLTPMKPVPRDWFGELAGKEVLALASGGGQQGPILAAAGATVTVFDLSPAQLEQDRMVAERDRLPLSCVQGDMRDLGALDDERFDLVFHPVSNCFVPDVRPVWREAFRVLKPGGVLLAGFGNPAMYIFDYPASLRGELIVRHPVPYSDLTSITPEERQRYVDEDEPLSFGHSLGDQIAGQLDAGFLIAGFYEDSWPPDSGEPLDEYMPCFIATRAVKP